jgi:hypothetical protein
VKVRVTLTGEDQVCAEIEVSESTYCVLCALADALNEQKVPYAPEMEVEEL